MRLSIFDFRLSIVLLIAAPGGCATMPEGRRATDMDPITAMPHYWLDQPPIAQVQHHHFQELWDATERVVRGHLFRIDRADYRLGLLTTHPMISRQWFEPWRRDTATAHDTLQSSLGTVRRTLRFEFAREEDGTYRVMPKVLVERLSRIERRYTSALQYGGTLMAAPPPATAELEPGVWLPPEYWYAIGRDEALERQLANAIERWIR